MKIKNVDFPKDLLNALRDGELVVFAGAGVSMGTPACLPSFEGLARMIAQGTGKDLPDGELIDRFLGSLNHAGVNVHVRAAEILSCEDREATELHQNLLRIYSDAAQVRIVTTNFDPLFEKVAESVFGDKPEVFRAPALPLGHQFNGIVHVHGSVDRSNEMVLTDADFGRAYLTEGWARRFLVELFRNFSVLFVGYSHNDAILSYLARALPVSEKDRFALIGEKDNGIDRWGLLGIEPISYSQSTEDDYSILCEGVCGLADLVQRSVIDWRHEITEIAQKRPPLEGETADLIEYVLEDDRRIHFFTEAASDPEWIDWLDKRGHLDALFGDGTLSERDRTLSKWLAEKFAYDYAGKLFLLISKHNMSLHPNLWFDLSRKIQEDKDFSPTEDTLSRWISLLLTKIPVHGSSYVFLSSIGGYCINRGMLDILLQVFDAMARSRLFLEKGLVWPNTNADDANVPIHVELRIVGDHHSLNQLWENGLKPKLPQLALPLFKKVIKHLEEQYLTQKFWQKANREWERASGTRSAIEPHDQDSHPKAVDVLIDAARDCLEWLIQKQRDKAAYWCAYLVESEVPLFRRLAVHGLSQCDDLTADEKVDWLLNHIDLHDLPVYHEVFRVARMVYPQASTGSREVLIEAVRTYCWRNGQNPESAERTAYRHFEWFHWLHESDPNCELAQQALNEILTDYPRFKPSEHPDLTSWSSPVQDVTRPSPWTVEELLAKPAADWIGDFLSLPNTEWGEFLGLMSEVTKAARQKFKWGLALADALAKNEKWDVHFWDALIRAWSEMELDENKYRQVLHWLSKAELHPKHSHEIANVLYSLVKDSGVSYTLRLLPQANEIAAFLWRNLDRTEQIEERNDWLGTAINHPAGILTIFWLAGFFLWRKEQEPVPIILSDEYRTVLSDIVQDRGLSGRLGRTVLAGNVAFLLAVDEVWTKKNLLPLFEPDSDDFQSAWDGFLIRGRLSPAVADAMADLSLKAVARLYSDLCGQRNQFIKHYTSMIAYFVEDPFEKWIPTLLQDSSQETKDCFAWVIGNYLRDLDEEAQRRWWQRWLRRYWENRLQGVPSALEDSEVEHMLDWLPRLTTIFPEAVDLAVQMPSIPLQNYHVIHELTEKELWQSHPEEVAKLLVHWGECDLRRDFWFSGIELIDKLLQTNISPEIEQKLEELKVQL